MIARLTDPRERTRFARFAIVGAIGAVVDFGVMNLLTDLAHIDLVAAGTISFIAAILSNFTWNRLWTYPDSRSKSILRQLMEFSVVSVLGLVIRLPILAFLEPVLRRGFQGLGFLAEWAARATLFEPGFLAKNITLAIAILVVMLWNFFVNRYWTYADVS